MNEGLAKAVRVYGWLMQAAGSMWSFSVLGPLISGKGHPAREDVEEARIYREAAESVLLAIQSPG